MAGRVNWGSREVLLGALAGALAVLAIWLAFSLQRALPGDQPLAGGRRALLISAGFEFFFVAVALWYVIVRRGGTFASLGFVRPRADHWVAWAVLAWLTGVGASFGWVQVVDQMGWEFLRPTDSARELLRHNVELWLAFVVVGVVAPFTEEIFFRGFAFSGFRRDLGLVAGVVISAVLFALFHVEPTVFVPTFIFGIVLAWVYVKTGSIWPAMFAHALNNVVVLVVAASGVGA
ncbi:MAG: CPBP family intramembrane metalloprotease [SAR202 cluster bacterium]|nr:CPBP family intramembrane metalloprotease [SAR202 cluster bacterium]